MNATYSITTDHNYEINQTPRKTLVHCPGSACRENSVQVYATTRNPGNERNKFLSNQNKIKPTFTGKVEAWKENLILQNGKPLKIGMPQLIIQTDASKTCWGWGSLSGNHQGGNLVISGKNKTYQCTEVHCSETCTIDLYRGKISNSKPLTKRQ